MLTVERIDTGIVELSVSEWFYRNRAIAGFDNPARSLYVSIRETVENSLDACENARVLPNVTVNLQPVSKSDPTDEWISASPQIYRLSVQDNGTGIPKGNVPQLIGKMLTGTKFLYKQSRGTFGLGGSLALLYGQVTTQKPIKIMTSISGESHKYYATMKLDIEKNQPIILEETEIPKRPEEHGTIISFHLEGDWFRSKRKIIDYFVQTSIIVPYSSLSFKTPEGDSINFPRVIGTLPTEAKEAKPHPSGVDVEMLKQMIHATRTSTFRSFMMSSFQRVGSSTAHKFLEYAGLDPEMRPQDIGNDALLQLANSMKTYGQFMAPSARSLSPASEEVLEAGMNRLDPEVVVVRQRAPSVYRGHPFIIETGVAYGGAINSGVRLYRFANRIPLLYDERNDVSSRVIREMNLKNYGLRQEDPLAFFVHISSTKIPFKTVGKEYIADVDEVRREIDLGLKDCLRKLGKQVRKQKRVQHRLVREDKLLKYYGFMARTLTESTGRPVTTERLFGVRESER